MEFKISDLLDDLQEVNVDILPYTSASEDRIKELTMEKIQKHGKYEGKRRGMGFVGKLLIAAALIAALALPVMAAGGFRFSDWLDGIIKPNTNDGYDENLLLGADSKVWDASGWAVRISAEEESATGLTFVCEELGNPEKSGTLTTTEGYWLEKWDGTTYVSMENGFESVTVLTVEDSTTARWAINWESVYGTLESGSYRIGKTFTYTNTAGETEELTYYAKFRIFTQEMGPYLEKYQTAFDALHEQENYHLLETNYPSRKQEYAYYTEEIWKHGDDYLSELKYYNEDGSLWSHHGSMLRDGKGYSLEWAGDDVLSGVSEWESVDWLEPSSFDSWHRLMSIIESILGQVYEDGNTLRFYEYSDFRNEAELSQETIEELNEEYPSWNHDYTERSYTFDAEGNLTHIQTTQLLSLDAEDGDPIVTDTLEVLHTPADEIARVIEAQNVSGVNAFSWSADQEKYASLANTDGFRNTDQSPIDSAQDAIARAKKEAVVTENPKYREAYEYNLNSVWHDESAGMWKVRFTHSQDDACSIIVYMNDSGVTRMTVYPYGDPMLEGAFSWEQSYSNMIDENGTILEGFKNTEPISITCVQDAIDRALTEADPTAHPRHQEGDEFDVHWVYYDEATGMWQVMMCSSKNISLCSIVYMDSNGITQMLYYEP